MKATTIVTQQMRGRFGIDDLVRELGGLSVAFASDIAREYRYLKREHPEGQRLEQWEQERAREADAWNACFDLQLTAPKSIPGTYVTDSPREDLVETEDSQSVGASSAYHSVSAPNEFPQAVIVEPDSSQHAVIDAPRQVSNQSRRHHQTAPSTLGSTQTVGAASTELLSSNTSRSVPVPEPASRAIVEEPFHNDPITLTPPQYSIRPSLRRRTLSPARRAALEYPTTFRDIELDLTRTEVESATEDHQVTQRQQESSASPQVEEPSAQRLLAAAPSESMPDRQPQHCGPESAPVAPEQVSQGS
jgi:hypothetical protein